MRIGTSLIAAAIVVVWIIAITCCYVVDEREQAVVLQFGNPVQSRTEPGLYFKIPFIQTVRYLPRTRQFWGGTPTDLLPDLPTQDGKKVEVTPWAIWRITDPIAFVKVLREISVAQKRVQQYARNAVRDTITQYPLIELVRSTNRELKYTFGSELVAARIDPEEDASIVQIEEPAEADLKISIGREKIIEEIKTEATSRIAHGQEGSRGIEIIDVGLAKIDFVDSVRQAAFQRLITFMESIAAQYNNEGEREKQKIINQTEAEVQRIEGEGQQQANETRGKVDAEIIRNYASAIQETGDFYAFLRTLEAYKAAISGNTKLILTTDSDFLNLLTKFQAAVEEGEPSGNDAQPATSPSE